MGRRESKAGRLRFILFELRQRRIHAISRMRVRGEDVVVRTKPTGLVWIRGVDSDNGRCSLGIFTSRNARATLGAKSAFVLEIGRALREMVAKRASGQLE